MVSKEGFFRIVRDAFRFLETEHGFRELSREEGDNANEFSINYENDTTKVYVEGISWGTAAMAWFGPKGAKAGNDFDLVPVWAVAKMLDPEVFDGISQGGQIEQIKANAAAITNIGQPVLEGDFSILEPARKFLIDRVRSYGPHT